MRSLSIEQVVTVPFSRPTRTGNEAQYVMAAIQSPKMSGDGIFTKQCQQWFEDKLGCYKALLTPNCTQALEMAAILIDIQPGDEVIMPSYTFVSTANAFVLRGAKIVFVDIRPDTMNIDESLIEAAITSKTKAIVPVHYAGVACEMDAIMALANRYDLFVIEDAAQGMMSKCHGKALGTIGHLGAYSFHETKNYTSGGEGGLLIINDQRFVERAEIIREKGTNRSNFLRGMVDKYTWVDLGSSYLPSELQAAYLWGQLENADEINEARRICWQRYSQGLQPLIDKELVELPGFENYDMYNAQIFYLKSKNIEERRALLSYLKAHHIMADSHYLPLHSSQVAKKFARFVGEDRYTTRESERLVRLPLFYGLSIEAIDCVVSCLIDFYVQGDDGLAFVA